MKIDKTLIIPVIVGIIVVGMALFIIAGIWGFVGADFFVKVTCTTLSVVFLLVVAQSIVLEIDNS